MSLLLTLMLAAAPAKGPTTLIIEVAPEDTVVFVDGKKKGTGAKPITLKNISPGAHIIKLQRKGESHEDQVILKAGEKKTWKWAFEGSGPPPKPKEAEKPKETKVEEEKKDEDLSLEKM